MLLIFIIIGLFTNALYVLNVEHKFTNPTKDAFYPDHTGKTLTSSLVHTYLLSLGDFTVDGYQSDLVWWEFVAATFIIQLTFINMLIAIMSDIFAQVMSTRQ